MSAKTVVSPALLKSNAFKLPLGAVKEKVEESNAGSCYSPLWEFNTKRHFRRTFEIQ